MSNETKPTSNKPDFYVYTAQEREGRKTFWNKLGVAYHHKDGVGINIQLFGSPLDGLTYGLGGEGYRLASR